MEESGVDNNAGISNEHAVSRRAGRAEGEGRGGAASIFYLHVHTTISDPVRLLPCFTMELCHGKYEDSARCALESAARNFDSIATDYT
ncbi:hypothetical protein EVAR_30549_1 [Eumeta japonica]|uniref:Uncharacterized protein n=1 Tax=Eumeta variegata TaxID=151549 RepID=A0A4C1VP99_EUMVA|nr:hypothetical protein EVAR_30549_1 [Eumeta japonica]